MTNRTRLLILGVVVVIGVVVVSLAVTHGWTDSDEIERLLTESGAWGPIVFILIMWIFQPFGIPGLVFMVPAGLVWPGPEAVLYSWIGNMGASSIAFAFARWIGRDWAQQHIPPRIQAWNTRIADDAVRPVFILRVFTGMLPPADWLLGISSVRWRPFLIGTAFGIIPGILVNVLAGASLFSYLSERGGNGRLLLLIVAVVAIRQVLKRRRSKALAATGE